MRGNRYSGNWSTMFYLDGHRSDVVRVHSAESDSFARGSVPNSDDALTREVGRQLKMGNNCTR